MRNTYPSDISCERFEKIRLILESVRKKTKQRRLDLYELFYGVLYVLKSCCQWRMLPKEFPKWRNCYDYFKKWSKKTNKDRESVLEIVLKKLVGEVRSNRPTDSKKNSSHACWFWALEMVALFKFLTLYVAELILIHLRK